VRAATGALGCAGVSSYVSFKPEKPLRRLIATLSYIVTILLVNIAFVKMPELASFGVGVSSADLVVGIIYIVRDFAQREIGHWVILAMLVGCLISYWCSDPLIAVASVSAFAIAETIDWAIFTFTGKPLSQRLLLSSIASSPVDTYVFLTMAHRFNWMSFAIMTFGKIIGVLLLWLCWRLRRTREDVAPDSRPLAT